VLQVRLPDLLHMGILKQSNAALVDLERVLPELVLLNKQVKMSTSTIAMNG
jgi:hypothetical protein